MIKNISNSKEMKDRIFKINQLQKELNKLKREKNKIEKEYSNVLLEKIAKQDKNKSILSSSIDNSKIKIDELNNKIENLEININDLKDLSKIKDFLTLKEFISKNSQDIFDFKEKTEKFYVLKVVFYVYLFLIPLWLTFYFFYKYNKKIGNYIIAHLSVNVANVAFIFILFYLLWLVYTFIPKVFLSKVLSFFIFIGMEFMFSIFGIIFFMGLFALIIVKLQSNRKIDLKEKNKILINKSICHNCNNRFDYNDVHCGTCGTKVKKECKKCNHNNFLDYDYCSKCGYNLIENN